MKNFLQLSAALASSTKGTGVVVSRSAIAVCHSTKICTVLKLLALSCRSRTLNGSQVVVCSFSSDTMF